MELEIEEIIILGNNIVGSEKRYKIRLKGTNITLNVRAENDEDAIEKAMKIINGLEG
ncbi:MAG: hypothetical protein F7B60_05995 [Desulfurococcales archaeon]|nr:hypothetical protein [Desulfurococcales archaeon]